MNKAALLILDGWGIGNHQKPDAIFNAKTPFFDGLTENHPNASLLTHGEYVGLPEGQMGNSEVGHLTIGAGRVIYQELTRIDRAIKIGEFSKNEVLLKAIHEAKSKGVKLHFMGLVSTGGVHSSQEHLFEMLRLAQREGYAQHTFVHGFTDGRDCNPTTGKKHFQKLVSVIEETKTNLSTVIGRYYAMDRDKRWARVAKAYHLMTSYVGQKFDSTDEMFDFFYSNEITDEFLEASVLTDKNGKIEAGDVVICFNFRTDRCREICEVLTQKDHLAEGMKTLPISLYTMTEYDSEFKNVEVIFKKEKLKNTLGEIVANAGGTQVRIAETEKYPHVSYFFSGGKEDNFSGESRILIPSPKVATYDLQPEMSAHLIADAIVNDIDTNSPDFICLNFANTDMVGHTGVYDAIVKAAEEVDAALEKVVGKLNEKGYKVVIIADHGNADNAINPDGSPNTAHSLNPVPIIVLGAGDKTVVDGTLIDVAPTILELMNINKPADMTGNSILR